MGTRLPKGIWYEKDRERYRVRLYRGDYVRHLSYHETQAEAIETWKKVKEKQGKEEDLLMQCMEGLRAA